MVSINNNSKLYKQLFYNNIFLQTIYNKRFGDFYKDILFVKENSNMLGGAFSVEYKDTKISFNKQIENDRLTLYLSTIDDNDNCIMIIVDMEEKTAYIEGITQNKYTNCFSNPELNNGKTIMEITIKMLKKYKDKLKLKYIKLKDNSFIQCNLNVQIWLSDLSMLQHNETFYSRFGFKPENKDIYEQYLENRVILKRTHVNKIKLEKILDDYDKKIDKNLKQDIINHYNKHCDINIVQWFFMFSHKFMKQNCELFKYLIIAIHTKLKLSTLHHESYTLEL